MADTLTITGRFTTQHSDGTQPIDTGSGSQVVTLASSRVYSTRMTITEGGEITVAIGTLFPNVGASAHYHIRNLSTSDFVKFGYATTVYVDRISKNEPKIGQFEGTPSIFLRADNADCEIELTVVNA